jgi:hypothetical protein
MSYVDYFETHLWGLGFITNLPQSLLLLVNFQADFIKAFPVLPSFNNQIVFSNALLKTAVPCQYRRHLSPKRPEA